VSSNRRACSLVSLVFSKRLVVRNRCISSDFSLIVECAQVLVRLDEVNLELLIFRVFDSILDRVKSLRRCVVKTSCHLVVIHGHFILMGVQRELASLVQGITRFVEWIFTCTIDAVVEGKVHMILGC
jgi:hypothetical protein